MGASDLPANLKLNTRASSSVPATNIAVRVAGHASYMLVGNAFTLLLGLPFQVYLARQLGAEGLGAWGLFEALVAVLSGVLSFGASQTVLKYVSHHLARGEHETVKS